MAEELDEEEFFQQDFTTASDWEIFNARLEEIFHEWKLPFIKLGENLTKNQLSFCEWDITTETINFADCEVGVSRYRAKHNELKYTKHEKSKNLQCQAFNDLMSFENDYSISDEKSEKTIHPLARWYGLRDFVVLYPARNSITNESQIKILSSSVHIAVAESSVEIPVFIHVLDKIQHVYLGVCEFQSIRLNFDIIHLTTIPPDCQNISRILKLFHNKVGVKYQNSVVATFREIYRLSKFYSTQYLPKRQSGFNDLQFAERELKLLNIFPFGVDIDPVMEIILYATGPRIEEALIVDGACDANYQSNSLRMLSIRVRFEELRTCFMSRCVSLFLNLTELNLKLEELLDDVFMYSGNVSIDKNPLDVLTEPKISTIIPNLWMKNETKKGQKIEGPLDDEILMNMLYYLFPDAQANSKYTYDIFLEHDVKENFVPLKIKTAFPDSLVHRLANLLAICYSDFGGIKAIAQFWAEFCQEMRYRIINCIHIPGIAKGFPDLRTCLLHQKFQMLNICMERRRIRESGVNYLATENEEELEEEFFDCSDGENEEKETIEIKPLGRMHVLDNMSLIDSDELIYVPFTQDPVPKTEDQLEDDAKVMLELGPGSELHAQMMSASLFSDMESFKAANPNGRIEDFIRWYSPCDWIEDLEEEIEGSLRIETHKGDQRKGKLSCRMLIPGNIWQEVWSQAKPIPARRQKRLFDDAKEAEKVLHFLESLNIGGIAKLSMACLFHSAINIVEEELKTENYKIVTITETVEQLSNNCCKLSRENWYIDFKNPRANSLYKWEKLLDELKSAEYMVEKIRSLKFKLFSNISKLQKDDNDVIDQLLNGKEVEIDGIQKNSIAFQVLQMFAEAKYIQNEQSFENEDVTNIEYCLPKPIEKQFTFRVTGNTVNKRFGGPQFLRAILGTNEFRLCGAFSKDTTFY